jgi:phage gp36-like protein
MREQLRKVREQDLTIRYVSFAFINSLADGSNNLSNYSMLSCKVANRHLMVDLLISGYIGRFHLWLNIFSLILRKFCCWSLYNQCVVVVIC